MTLHAAMPTVRRTLVAGLLVAASGFAGAAETRPVDPMQDGERMIARCLDYAASQKLTPLSLAVIDASGTLVAFKRQAGAGPATVEAALLKARTAMRLNAATAELGPAVAEDASTRDTFLILQLTTLPGGVPFERNGVAAGAIGVSGALPAMDAECARRAVEPAVSKDR